MVNLTRIYTRTGDQGTTRLGDFSEVAKTDARIEAYAACDEAGAHLGVVLTSPGVDPELCDVLVRLQHDLFDAGADLCTPVRDDLDYEPLRITQDYIDRLEGWCDTFNESLEPLRSFVLSGGTPAAAQLHVARTVARRAERAGWAAYAEHGESMNVLVLTFLNRLSDLLFIAARYANRAEGDVLWEPGANR